MSNEFRVVPSDVGVGSLRGRTYTNGFSDALGNRRVAQGRPGEPLLDVLEFTPALADASGFEPALRSRVAALGDVNPFSLAAVVAVERADGLGLCLVTEHVPGRRLSELEPAELGAELALDLIRTVTPVLAALNPAGVGAAHGALSAGRIVVEPDGRLIVVEHVLGWAFEATGFSRAKLNEFGILVPAGPVVRFDGRMDVVQLGFLGLSIWLRRQLELTDFPDKMPELLDEAVAHEDSPELAERLRAWIERALQIGPRPFASAHDAIDALDELPGESEAVDTESESGLLAFHSEPPSQAKSSPAAGDQAEAFNVAQMRAAIEQRQATAEPHSAPAPRITRHAAWILAALCVIALGGAVAMGLLAFRRPAAGATTSAVDSVETTPFPSEPVPTSTTGTDALQDTAAPPGLAGRDSSSSIVPTIGSRLASGRFGGLTIASALDFLVSADGAPVGRKGAPIALAEGSHRLEFVNDAVGFRQTQTVKVSYGEMTVLRVPMPYGRMSVNATPWAEVTIDGKGVGETPIANYVLPVGAHEIVFRHPEMGERRQSVVVKVGEYVRVTQAFDRSPEQGPR